MKKMIVSTLCLYTGMLMAFDIEQCRNKAISTIDMVNCYEIALDAADKKMNKTYHALMKAKVYSPIKLKKAQQAWINFRDLNCHIYEAGTIFQVQTMHCFVDTTEARFKELKALCQGLGDTPYC